MALVAGLVEEELHGCLPFANRLVRNRFTAAACGLAAEEAPGLSTGVGDTPCTIRLVCIRFGL